MNLILSAASELQRQLLQHEWCFCFIGGIAVLRWGKPRTTQDVDVSLFVKPGDEVQVIQQLLEKFPPRIDDAADFALESRVVLIQSSRGIPYDILLAHFDFEKAIIDRASYFDFSHEDCLLTVSAEDLIVMKAFAGRDQDWLDVRGILECSPDIKLDVVRTQLQLLSELQPENRALDAFDELCR